MMDMPQTKEIQNTQLTRDDHNARRDQPNAIIRKLIGQKMEQKSCHKATKKKKKKKKKRKKEK